jgi:23S rRNA (guanosine2251-2'-O)-methyltransferase
MSNNKRIVLIVHNVRSAHNVGSMFRTADGAGVDEIILSGYTPCPPKQGSLYLTTAEKELKKTALGAEASMSWKKVRSFSAAVKSLKKDGFEIVALEQHETSIRYDKYCPNGPVVLIVGNEVRGIDSRALALCDTVIEIPMHGTKNSLNVSVSTGIALYHLQQCAN